MAARAIRQMHEIAEIRPFQLTVSEATSTLKPFHRPVREATGPLKACATPGA